MLQGSISAPVGSQSETTKASTSVGAFFILSFAQNAWGEKFTLSEQGSTIKAESNFQLRVILDRFVVFGPIHEQIQGIKKAALKLAFAPRVAAFLQTAVLND